MISYNIHWVDIDLEITCEACGSGYEAFDTIPPRPSFLTRLLSGSISQAEKLARIENGDFSDLDLHKCPRCGNIQFWNLPAAQKRNVKLIAYGAGIFLFSAFMIILSTRPNFRIEAESLFSMISAAGLLSILIGLGIYLAAKKFLMPRGNPDHSNPLIHPIPPKFTLKEI